MKKRSQKTMCLEILKKDIGEWLPAHYFVGYRIGTKGVVYLSYKAPARLSELYRDIPEIERKKVIGITGAKYYSYKLTVIKKEVDK